MVLCNYGSLFSLGLLLSAVGEQPQVGVTLKLRGVTIPNDSFVDLDDVMYTQPSGPRSDLPSNTNSRDEAVLCVTDLENCCDAPRTVRGGWYFPDGTRVGFGGNGPQFQVNRGPNEEIDGQTVYGSVRLYRRYGTTPGRGRFRCELPNAANPNVNQIRYVIILNFGFRYDLDHVIISPSTGSTAPTAGEAYSLTCSATLFEPASLPSGVPSPNFQWLFNGSTSLPSGVTAMSTVMSSSNSTSETYTGTLQFSPLNQSYTGMYTCQLGPARLENSAMVTVNVPSISIMVTANLNTPLMVGQTDNTLTCGVSGADNLNSMIIWTKNGSARSQVDNSTTLSFTPLSLSHAGNYSCSITSTLLNHPVMATNSQRVIIQIPDPQSVTITSNLGNMVLNGSDVTLTCSVQMGGNVLPAHLESLMMVNASITKPDGTVLVLSNPKIEGTTYKLTTRVISFGDNDVGNYTCNATVRPSPSAVYLTGMGQLVSIPFKIIIALPTAPPPPSQSPGNTLNPGGRTVSGGSNSGAIAGGVVAVIIVLAAVGAVTLTAFILFMRRRKHSTASYEQAAAPTKKGPPIPVAYSKRYKRDDIEYCNIGLGINNKPQITKFPSDTTVIKGEGVYFRIKVSGEPQPTVTWYHDGEPIRADHAREIESDGSLTIPSTELKHSGVYKAVAANTHGSEERVIKLMINEEGGASTAAVVGEVVFSRPIPIPEFGKYVAELHANSNKPFKDLYQSLDTGEGGHSIEYATKRETKPLNRFANIVVYDDNRIVLKPLSDISDCQRDYINACYVDGYSIPNKFMVTQGPLPKTVVDFWRLIWQERPPTIVMVTNVKEGSKIKCQQYWPESGKKDFGPFQVTITDQQIFADYTIRTLSVKFGSERSHKVTQYHFTAWPDHGVPDYATPILAFHRRVKAQHHPSRGPMVIHCSAGVGRTGTFIVIDSILEQIKKEQVVDIPGAITKIRQKRMKMVQTHDQFTFIHDAILESVTCGDTQISATNLRMNIVKMKKNDNKNQPHGFQYQFKILEQVSPNPKEVHCSGALSCPDRNRSKKFLPADRWRVVMKGEQPDYIHAVNINGYKHKRAFIVAEGPMQSTVRNFWKMIYERKCAVVVMTSALIEGGQEASAQYWPDSGIAHYGEFDVDLLAEEELQGFTIRNISVLNTKTQKAYQVTQFHITCWRPDGHCSNLKSVTDVIEEMTKVQIRSGNKPIVVHCSDTVTRSGMFCAIATTIERCKTEGVVDVFQVVKALRVQKPGAVPTVETYKHIFDTILVYLESFDTYANFQNI